MILPRFSSDGGAFMMCVRRRRVIPREFLVRFYHRRRG